MADSDKTSLTIGDVARNFRDLLLERFANPLVTSFIVAWILINFKFVVIVFSNADIKTKLCLMTAYLGDGYSWWHIGHIWLGPLISAFGYTYAFPPINREILKFTNERKIELINDRIKAENKRHYDRAYINALNEQFNRDFDDLEKDKNRADRYATRLKAENEQLIEENRVIAQQLEQALAKPSSVPEKVKTIVSENNEFNISELGDIEQSVLKMLVENENTTSSNFMNVDQINSSLQQPKVLVKIALDNLLEKAFLYRTGSSYRLEKRGRELAVFGKTTR